MSTRALLKATESTLRTFLADETGKVCGIQPDGRPPPVAGQWYYAIHWGRSRGDGSAERHDVSTDVSVTITGRMGYAPRDRRGERMTLQDELIDRAEAIADADVVHGNYELLTAANAIIGTAKNGFIEPLVFLDMALSEKSGEWVFAESEKPPTVYAVEVRFGRARRVQRY